MMIEIVFYVNGWKGMVNDEQAPFNFQEFGNYPDYQLDDAGDNHDITIVMLLWLKMMIAQIYKNCFA